MKLLQHLRQAYDNFEMTIAEGNYRTQPKSIWNLFSSKRELPETTEVMVGATALGTSRSFGGKLLWAGAIAIASFQAMAYVAAGLAVTGIGIFAVEYAQSRKARKDIITEVNFAGQKVQGTRADLYHLHRAQVQIMNLGSSFQQASMESTSDTVNRIAGSVAEYSKRVKVVDAGRYGAGTDAYEFSEPGIKLVHDRPVEAAHVVAAKPAVSELKLAPAFTQGAQMSEEEVVQRILDLEKALPPNMQEKLQQGRNLLQPKAKAAA